MNELLSSVGGFAVALTLGVGLLLRVDAWRSRRARLRRFDAAVARMESAMRDSERICRELAGPKSEGA